MAMLDWWFVAPPAIASTFSAISDREPKPLRLDRSKHLLCTGMKSLDIGPASSFNRIVPIARARLR